MRSHDGYYRWDISRIVIYGLLIVSIIIVDEMTGEHLIGGLIILSRFLWQVVLNMSLFAIRKIDMIFMAIFRGRVLHGIGAIIAVNMGYAARVIMSDSAAERLSRGRRSVRAGIWRIRRIWTAAPFLVKVLIVAVAIFLQMWLLPVWSEYVILFPIGFIIHGIEALYRRIFGAIANKAIDRVVGDKHHKLIERVSWLERSWRMLGLWKLRLRTGWRLWRYDPQYRNPKTGKRRKSFFEVVRLWRSGKLDRYFGRPLLGGHRDDPAME